MTSTLYLYKDSKIIPSKNFVVDSIEEYLATLTTITITDFQFIRTELNLEIKIDKSQDFSGSLATYNYNYLKVVQNGVSYYYFVVKKTQVAQSTIRLELKMDTLNTYKWDTAFKVSARTQVNREHKERLFRYVYEFHSTRTYVDFPFDNKQKVKGDLLFFDGIGIINVECIVWYQTTPASAIGFHAESLSRGQSDWLFKNRSSTTLFFMGVTINGTDYFVTDDALANCVLKVSLLRNIDYLSEGMDIPLYKKELGVLRNKEDSTWNLIYHNDNNEAINCHCIPSNSFLSARVFTDNELTYNDFEDGAYYTFASFSSGGSRVDQYFKDNNNLYYYTSWIGNTLGTQRVIWQIKRSGTTLQIRRGYGDESRAPNGFLINYDSWQTITSITFDEENLYYIKTSSVPSIPATYYIFPDIPSTYFSTTEQVEPLDSLQDVDRVDSQLIKIISIPYFPTEYSYDDEYQEIAVYESTWTYSTLLYKGFRLNDLSTKFKNTIISDIDNPLMTLISKKNASLSNPDLTSQRLEENESKLFHSDFYQPKFVYDSFGFTFGLERINIFEWVKNYSQYFTFEFVMTSTINSKFLFAFPEYILTYSSEDYDNVLAVARNNEEPIYNSSYITYLRTAYRYDLKSINYNNIQRGVSLGVGTAKNTISMTEDLLGKDYGSAISGFLSWGQGLVSTIFGSQKERIALQSKLESLKSQANSVSGSDDLDLLDYYSQNRAKLCLYQMSDRMKKMVFDLFYYYGYTTNEIKIPEINTRKWFNFLSCELAFTGIDNNISDSCREDIVNKYKEGATFLHMNEISSVKTWDFDQTKENWESNLFE